MEKIIIKTQDDVALALWKISAQKQPISKNIFLTHGTFSDKRICLGIANYFAKAGYTCWIMEWRSHGDSMESPVDFDMEVVAELDIKVSLDYLLNSLEIKSLYCITHSGGGIALTMFLSRNPAYQEKILGIVLFGCQAFGAGHSKLNIFRVFAAKYLSYLIGFIPGVMLGLGVQSEPYGMMKPWFDWNLRKQFKGKDGFDYLTKMKSILIPVMSVCGAGDTLAAPRVGCELYLNAFGSIHNKFLYCSIDNGFQENYDHSRVILSRNASKEIWPLVLEWVEEELL